MKDLSFYLLAVLYLFIFYFVFHLWHVTEFSFFFTLMVLALAILPGILATGKM